jgi:hypothetical protein
MSIDFLRGQSAVTVPVSQSVSFALTLVTHNDQRFDVADQVGEGTGVGHGKMNTWAINYTKLLKLSLANVKKSIRRFADRQCI